MTEPTRYCARCGAKLRPGGRFCGVCGSPVVDRPAPPRPLPAAAAAAELPEAATPPPVAQPPAAPLAPEQEWPSVLPEPAQPAAAPPPPPAGLQPPYPEAPEGYTPTPPGRQGRGNVPCIIGGCLVALAVLALGCWAVYSMMLLPAAQQYKDLFGKINASLTPVASQPAVTVLPVLTATPAPPAASATPPKPTASPTPVQVYTANFSGAAADWTQKSDASGRQYVQDAAYHTIFTSTTAATFWLTPISRPVFKDFTLEIKARYESGPERDGYGAVLRFADNDNFYFFLVTADGKWGFAKRVKGAWTSLVPLTANSAIVKGKAANTLRVVAKGASFTFSVNGTQVGAFSDGSHAAGTVGVFTSNETAGTFHCVYEAFKASILSP